MVLSVVECKFNQHGRIISICDGKMFLNILIGVASYRFLAFQQIAELNKNPEFMFVANIT